MNTRTRILYIINSLNVGGAQVGFSRLVTGLNPDQYDVTVVALNGGQKEIVGRVPDWVELIDFDGSFGTVLTKSDPFLRIVRSADVIVGSLFHSVLVARAAGLLNRRARVLTWQHSSEFKSPIRRWLFKYSANLSDLNLADSESVGEMFLTELKLNEKHVHVVPIAGISLNDFQPVRHEGTTDIVVGSIGQLSEAKNYHVLLKVAECLSNTDIDFKVAGDGVMREELVSAVDDRGLTNVRFLGDINHIPDFLSTTDIYFQPSKREGLCIAVLEAMAAGLPVVGSEVGGIGRNVDHGRTGILCNPEDVAGFVSSIRLLARKPELRNQFGDAGRVLVSEKYSQKRLVDEFSSAISVL